MRLCALALLGIATFTLTGPVRAQDTAAGLRAEIEALKQQVQSLERRLEAIEPTPPSQPATSAAVPVPPPSAPS